LAKVLLDENTNLTHGEKGEKSYTICGRVKFLRLMGKAVFAKIEDESAALQIYFNQDDLGEWFGELKKLLEVGDIIEASGFAFVTKTGEISLHAKRLEILTKAVAPLPEKFHGLTDTETRYRQRYLDLIMNPEVRTVFATRSKIVSLIRRFFEDSGFLEVETPMLHPIAGGANARPFITHHNALSEDRYLRIAPELYLKRLIVGGFEAVFEINRNFRNEGIDYTHNPEFTMIEFYWAYHNHNDLMALTEKLFDYLLNALDMPQIVEFDEMGINFATPFKKIGYKDSIIQIGGAPEALLCDLASVKEYIKEKNIEAKEPKNYGEALSILFDELVEKKLINPTFITDFPVEISPLAKRNPQNPEIADRFELFIAGREIANGFNELNDPIDQYERFLEQVKAKAAGDDEACEMDEDYIEALKYGMAPTAGEGIGIDRLVMLLTGQRTIKDVLLFPAMRRQG
jgi:lysyl-tRNA synthetase class 2